MLGSGWPGGRGNSLCSVTRGRGGLCLEVGDGGDHTGHNDRHHDIRHSVPPGTHHDRLYKMSGLTGHYLVHQVDHFEDVEHHLVHHHGLAGDLVHLHCPLYHWVYCPATHLPDCRIHHHRRSHGPG